MSGLVVFALCLLFVRMPLMIINWVSICLSVCPSLSPGHYRSRALAAERKRDVGGALHLPADEANEIQLPDSETILQVVHYRDQILMFVFCIVVIIPFNNRLI